MTVGEALIQESKRHLLEESWPRIEKCVAALSETELWHRDNANTNSVGNLLLHLSGNVRQWIVSGLGTAPDERVRSLEFEERGPAGRGPVPAAELLTQLQSTLSEAGAVLDRLDPNQLLETRTVQGFETTGVSVLVHVIEHFSYHVGQITHMVKAIKDIDMKYYDGQKLDARNPS